MAASLTRRRLVLAGGGLALAGGAAWSALRPPAVPELTARPLGDLVLLDGRLGGAVDATLVGLGDDARAPAAPPDRATVEDAGTAPARGDGPTTVVAFYDVRCPSCRSSLPAWLAAADAGRLRLLVRDWPILGAPSVVGARAALAARLQGAYWPVFEALMTTSFLPTVALVRDLAARHGLDPVRLEADMAAPGVDATLAANAALATGVRGWGTPTYVADGVVVRRGYPVETVLALAARHRSS